VFTAPTGLSWIILGIGRIRLELSPIPGPRRNP
jgi:hypothetical protein